VIAEVNLSGGKENEVVVAYADSTFNIGECDEF